MDGEAFGLLLLELALGGTGAPDRIRGPEHDQEL